MLHETPVVMPIRSIEDVRNIEAAFGVSAHPLDTDAAGTPAEALTLLNALPFWGKRFRWANFKRRGNILLGATEGGEQVRFEVDKLLRFAHAQSRILESLGIAIQTPKRGRIGETWAMAAELMVRAAMADTVDAGAPEDDLQADLIRCWRAAGEPEIYDAQLFGLLILLSNYRREPHAETAPPAVFVLNNETWCHLPVLREWLSTPVGGARYRTLPELREAAGLLGMAPRRVDREGEGRRIEMTFWVGPIALLAEGQL